MKLSIIVPNYNSKIIDKTIKAIINQETKYWFEVIVVGVDDFGLISQNEKVVFINTKTKCPPARARNIGASVSIGDLLVFIDSDCIPPPFWINEIIKSFNEEEFLAVGGGVKFKDNKYWTLADNISMFHSFMTSNSRRKVNELPSLNLAIKKDAFLGVNGFNEKYLYPSGEDFDLTLRLSRQGKLLFNPNAWIFHYPPRSSFQDLIKHSYIQGKYSTKINREGANILSIIIFKPIFLLLFSPIFALLATLKIFLNKNLLKYVRVFPAIYLSKFVWCIGAVNSPWQKR